MSFNSPTFWLGIIGMLFNLLRPVCPGLNIPNADINFLAQFLAWAATIIGVIATHKLTWAKVLSWLNITTNQQPSQTDETAAKVVALLKAEKLIFVPSGATGDHVLPAATKTYDSPDVVQTSGSATSL